MRKLTAAVLVPALLASCAPKVVVKQKLSEGKRFRVAVLPFKGHPSAATSGETATEAFSTCLVQVKKYDVVERGALEQVIKEQKLALTGAVDQSQAVEIGKLLGADGVVIGSVSKYTQRQKLMFPPAEIGLNARMVSTREGVVEWTAQHRTGGARRWLTIFVWPVLVFATALSPTAEDQIQNASNAICESLETSV